VAGISDHTACAAVAATPTRGPSSPASIVGGLISRFSGPVSAALGADSAVAELTKPGAVTATRTALACSVRSATVTAYVDDVASAIGTHAASSGSASGHRTH